jgi:hypothetical protein
MIYVTVVRGGRVGCLVGPFHSRHIAQSWVEPARRAVIDTDASARTATFAVSWVPGGRTAGQLNALVGYPGPADRDAQ